MVQSDGPNYIRRPKNTRYNPKYTKGTVKCGGGNIMVWGSFSWYGVGPLYHINGIMDKVKYREILKTQMYPFASQNLFDGWFSNTTTTPNIWRTLLKNTSAKIAYQF